MPLVAGTLNGVAMCSIDTRRESCHVALRALSGNQSLGLLLSFHWHLPRLGLMVPALLCLAMTCDAGGSSGQGSNVTAVRNSALLLPAQRVL